MRMDDDRFRPCSQLWGRGAQITPPNRFERIHIEHAFEQVEDNEDLLTALTSRSWGSTICCEPLPDSADQQSSRSPSSIALTAGPGPPFG